MNSGWLAIVFRDRLIGHGEILALNAEHTASLEGNLMHGVPDVRNPNLMSEDVSVECRFGTPFS